MIFEAEEIVRYLRWCGENKYSPLITFRECGILVTMIDEIQVELGALRFLNEEKDGKRGENQ
jgi:hypothetical protein